MHGKYKEVQTIFPRVQLLIKGKISILFLFIMVPSKWLIWSDNQYILWSLQFLFNFPQGLTSLC